MYCFALYEEETVVRLELQYKDREALEWVSERGFKVAGTRGTWRLPSVNILSLFLG